MWYLKWPAERTTNSMCNIHREKFWFPDLRLMNRPVGYFRTDGRAQQYFPSPLYKVTENDKCRDNFCVSSHFIGPFNRRHTLNI